MRAENDTMRSTVLETLFNEMYNAKLAASLVKKGEANNEYDILLCRHEDLGGDGTVMGQYFFPNYDGPENVMYFTAMLTVREDIDEAEAKRLAPKVAEVNEQTVCGHFVIYDGIGLVYKLVIPISEDLNEDDVYDEINIAAAHAISICASFKGLFV